jgi:flagellar biosynthetic protein FliS
MRGIAAYKQTRIATASPAHLVMMLFQEGVHRLTRAIQTLDDGEAWRKDVIHVREIYLELLNALDFTVAPELCANLARLYRWCIDELVAVGRDRSEPRLRGVLRVTTTLLEGWENVARGEAGAP